MAEFSLTSLFVVPVSNTVPTTGSTQDLAAGKTGIFLPDYSVATAANVANAKYIYLAQGRKEPYLTGSKKSDKIAKGNVVDFYRSIGAGSAQNQITQISSFQAKCEDSLVVTLRLQSYYINLLYYNGLTRSVVVKAPCCDCGGDPCAGLDATGHESVVDQFVAKINAEQTLSQYVVASKSGTGLSAILVITGKPVKVDNKVGYQYDTSINPFQQDRMYFRAFALKNPPTTSDFYDTNACETAATVTLTQRSTFGAKNTAAEVRMLQEYYHSYQSIHKDFFKNPGYNQTYEDFIDDSKIYDLFYIKFREINTQEWELKAPIDETVIIAVPQGNASDIQTILETYLGTASTAGNDQNANSPLAGNTVI
jgi:hypothetical protein